MSSKNQYMVTVTWMDLEKESFFYEQELPAATASVLVEDIAGRVINIPTRNVRYFNFSNNPAFGSLSTVDIVFASEDDLIGPDNLTFVEVERDGVSIKLGEWIRRDDGYLVLRIPDPEAV